MSLAFLGIDASAATFNVNTTADGVSSSGTVNLRGALLAVDGTGGTNTINVPAGTYNLSMGEIQFGNLAMNLTITGAGAGSTIINMTTTNQDRIFLIDPPGTVASVIVSISGISFTNGKSLTDGFGGGAICGGGPSNSLTISQCAFSSNSIPASTFSTYGGGAIGFTYGGTLSIDQCTFTSNSDLTATTGRGGAVYVHAYSANGSYPSLNVSITNSTFTSNTVATGGEGGAIYLEAEAKGAFSSSSAASILKNTFSSNSAPSGKGGAIFNRPNFNTSTTYTENFNRFVGNTASTGTALYLDDEDGSIDATNNWWDCNGGPTLCADKAVRSASATKIGALTSTPYLQLKTTAAAASICTSTATTITSGFTSNSASSAISAANLTALVGVGITFSATLGSISGAQTTIQASGTATATYTAGGSTGSGTVNAVVDNVPGSDATARATIIISTLGTWLGGTSTAWSNTANWGCNTLPTGSTDVVIPSGTTFSPQVDITTAVTNNLTINSGATLSFSGSTNILTINGALTNSGTFTATSGKVVFNGTTQTIPALTYKDLQINGGGNKTLGGSTTVNGTLTLTSGFILLGVNNLTIGSAGSISGGGSSSFVVTNSTGDLVQQNIGTAGRTGAILFPVGTGTGSYTPVSLNNTGTADNFTVGMLSSVYATYDASSNPTSAALTSDAVGKTWLISEAVGGGSTATATFQWNAADELSGFDRTNCFGSHFVNGGWNKGATSAAGGANPYTQTLTGLISFSPFGVGSANSPLPLKVLALSGNARGVSNELQWTTTNENGAEIFDVERGEDATNFHSIASLSAKGGASAPDNHYGYTDDKPVTPLSYYRIRMNDHGKLSYSNTVLIHQYEMAFTIDAGPNPFGDKLEIGLRNMPPAAGLCTILLTDAGGRVVRQTSILASTGNTSLSLEGLGGLAPGVYFLRVDAGQSARTIKVMKGQ